MRRPTLSLVLPLRNDAEVLKDLETQLGSWLSAYEVECEIVLVDDGSTDTTRAGADAWAARDGRVKVLSLLRPYGIEGALRAGLDHASGEAVVLVDGDIQDSAEVIPRMVETWRGGADLVHARRKPTQVERGLVSWGRRFIHELTDSITRNGVPQNAGNFRLVDQSVAERLKAATPASRNLRGLLAAVSRAQASVAFESIPSQRRKPRTLLAEVDDAFESVTRKSLVPIRLAYVIAVALFAVSAFAFALMLVVSMFHAAPLRSWLWLTPVIGVVGSLQLFFTGVVGEYVGRAFLDAQKLPPYTLAAPAPLREYTPALPEAPRVAMPSAVSINDSELEPVAAPTRTEPPPAPPPRASIPPLDPTASRPPPSVAPPPSRNSAPPPRLSPAPGQVRAIHTQKTVRLNDESMKAEAAKMEALKAEAPKPDAAKVDAAKPEPVRQDTVRLGEMQKVDAKPVTRPSNPPLPSKRSSVPPTALGSKPKLDETAKSGPVSAREPASAAPAAAPTSSPPAAYLQQPISARTKTLAGIPLPAMMAYAQTGPKSDAPPPKSAPPAAPHEPNPVVDRLKEDPKPLNTLHGVPSTEK